MSSITTDQFARKTSKVRQLLRVFAVLVAANIVAEGCRLWSILSGDVRPISSFHLDVVQGLLAIAYLIFFFASAIAFCFWIYGASTNVRALGAENLRYTPAATVALFFIPVVCWFAPYARMKDLWRASKTPSDWPTEPRTPLLPVWWACWIMCSIFSLASLSAAPPSASARELGTISVLSLAAHLLTVSATIALSVLIREIYDFQRGHEDSRSRNVPASRL